MRAITVRCRPLGVLLLVALALASGAFSTPSANALPGVGTDQVRVTAGWEGRARPGRLFPVQVSLTGPAAASPTIEVQVRSGNGGTTTTRTAVTAGPAATTRATVAVSAPRDLQSFEVVVTARHGSTTDTAKTSVQPVKEEELVGVLPDLARRSPPPATEPLSVPIGTARFVTVDLDTMSVFGSLGPLATVATTGAQLAALTPAQSLNLRSWLAAGGRLLVDEGDGPAPGLPPAWQPSTANPRTSAGLGEVRLTGGFLAAGRWAGAIEPTPTISPADPDVVTSAFSGGPVGQALARNSGLRIPSLGVVLAFLLGYVLLAGPITFFILHKLRRAELAWVVVPLLAVGFTLGGWAIGGQARDNTRTAYSASVLETDGADLNLSYVGVLSRQGGDRSVTFPGGWWGGNVPNELYGPAEAPVTATVRPAGTTAEVSLIGGEFAVLSGRGPTAPTAATRRLRLDAVAAPDGRVTGTVHNQTGQSLRQVAVFVGSRSVLVGDMAPQANRPFTVAAPPPTRTQSDIKDPAQSPFAAPEAKVWPSVATQTVDQRSGPVDLALWGETNRLLGPDLRSPGAALAVGWADRLPPPGNTGAGAEGRTAVIARSPVDPGPSLAGIAVRRDLLRGPSETTISDLSGPATGATFRFVLPAGKVDLNPLALQLSVPSTLSRVDAWDGLRWVTMSSSAGTTNPNGTPADPGPVTPAFDAPPTLVDLPQGSVIGGTVYVRVAVRFNGPSNSTGELLLQGR